MQECENKFVKKVEIVKSVKKNPNFDRKKRPYSTNYDLWKVHIFHKGSLQCIFEHNHIICKKKLNKYA